jgi:hypothetical protein
LFGVDEFILFLALEKWYNTSMKQNENVQPMTIYFPPDLLSRVRESAKTHRRSFNQETLWLLEQSLDQQTDPTSPERALSTVK